MDEREWVSELCDRVVREVRETLQGQHAELLRELSEMTREGKVVRLMEPPRNELVVLPHQVQEEARKSPQRGRPKSIQSARSGASEERGQAFDACVPVPPQPMNAAARAIMKKKREEGRPRNAYRKLSAHQMAALPRLQLAHMRLRQLLSTTFFEIISMLLIVSNVVFCGIEAEILSQDPERAVEVGLDVVSITYNVVFLIEFLLLVVGHGVIEHFTSAEWAWHLFDAVVVFFGVVEVVLFTLQQGGNFSAEYVRVVRLVKIFRVLRVVRVMRSLRGLRLLLLSLVHTIRSLIWTLSLLLVILWFFGIVFTTAANQQATMPNATEQEKLDKYFGSLWRTVFTLFKCSCNGMDWFEAEEVLEHLDQSWIWVGFFLLYICFTYFALLNIITGVFCHSAITGAFKNEDVVADELLVHKGLQGRRLLEIWDRMDYEGFGSLDESRFIEAFDDEQVALGLEVLGIKVTSPKEFFDFLAAESEMRMVFPERFVDVGLSLQGEAKALEVALMRQAMGLPGLAIRSSRNVEKEVSHEVSGARPER